MSAPHDVFRGYGVPIALNSPEDFLKIKETLTRMGVASNQSQTLYQSCHILHKRGQYAIVHFKELFCLDGKSAQTTITEEDIGRRNTIANLLSEWGLVKLVDPKISADNTLPLNQIKILSFAAKHEWNLVAKYEIGKVKQKP